MILHDRNPKNVYYTQFFILLSSWEWTNSPALCICMFIIIGAIQNSDKYCDIYFDRALGALLPLVCCDQGSIVYVCCCCCCCYEQQQQFLQSRLCVLLTLSHECHIKHTAYIQESDHTIIVSQCNTDYNMVSENGGTELLERRTVC